MVGRTASSSPGLGFYVHYCLPKEWGQESAAYPDAFSGGRTGSRWPALEELCLHLRGSASTSALNFTELSEGSNSKPIPKIRQPRSETPGLGGKQEGARGACVTRKPLSGRGRHDGLLQSVPSSPVWEAEATGVGVFPFYLPKCSKMNTQHSAQTKL